LAGVTKHQQFSSQIPQTSKTTVDLATSIGLKQKLAIKTNKNQRTYRLYSDNYLTGRVVSQKVASQLSGHPLFILENYNGRWK
jgi:hypothetical protein